MESNDQEVSIRQEASDGGEDKETREYRQRDPALNLRLEELFTKMRCPYCPKEKNITLKYKRNFYRHMKDSHPEELEPIIKDLATTKSNAQPKLPFNIVSTTNDPCSCYFITLTTKVDSIHKIVQLLSLLLLLRARARAEQDFENSMSKSKIGAKF